MSLIRAIRSRLRRVSFLRRWWARRSFPVEVALIEGRDVRSGSHDSIVFFSVQRGGSQYVKSILSRCAAEHEMQSVSFHGYAFQSTFPFLNELSPQEQAECQYLFRPRGFLYCDFHELLEGIDLDGFRLLLIVRDPRDVVTSTWFSLAWSHLPPWEPEKSEIFQKRREMATSMDIDEFALWESGRVRRIYERYIQWLDQRNDVCLLRYEDMVLDFDPWLDRLLEHCRFDVSPSLRATFRDEMRLARMGEENAKQHRRQVLPDDFRRKLSGAAIEELNRQLGEVLRRFRYPL